MSATCRLVEHDRYAVQGNGYDEPVGQYQTVAVPDAAIDGTVRLPGPDASPMISSHVADAVCSTIWRAGLTAYVNGPRISTRGSGDVLRRERYRSDAARSISNRCERDNDDTEAAILLTAASSALRSRLESPARGTSYMKT